MFRVREKPKNFPCTFIQKVGASGHGIPDHDLTIEIVPAEGIGSQAPAHSARRLQGHRRGEVIDDVVVIPLHAGGRAEVPAGGTAAGHVVMPYELELVHS